jgi:membrane-bound metal-dependent hydrolase YbcI (DUF457 family)
MNKNGHMAFAMGVGSMVMVCHALPVTPRDNVMAMILMAGIALGSLAPDIGHRTIMASPIITPFRAKRRQLKIGGWLLLLIGGLDKHRGLIHTPEFAAVLTTGSISLVQTEGWTAAALAGFALGWWLHLLGDVFGDEGIHSLIAPKLCLRIRLFKNSEIAEQWMIRIGWSLTLACWLHVLSSQLKTTMFIAN